jgi:signal transduction histidine kinase
MKDDFISIASHELKTPMAAIKGYISMMLEGIAGQMDQKAKDHLQKISSNVQRLDILVSELLDVSRLEQGRMQFDMQPYDISSITKEVFSSFKDQADSKKIQLIEQKLETMPQVFIDPDRTRQVLDNLIGNAIKYTLKGSVTVSYKIEENNLQTIVKDTGVGMSPEDRKQLFTKFYRIKTEKTADIPGTGLGLWIAREIVKKQNGEIYVDSMENVGSQFTVTLPYIKEEK